MQKHRVSQKVPNCNYNEPHGPFKIILRRFGLLREQQVADEERFFAPQI